MVDLGHTTDEGPEERHRIVQLQPGLGIAPCGLELEAVADDARILHQVLDLGIAHLRHPLHIEAEQHLSIMLALLQHSDP